MNESIDTATLTRFLLGESTDEEERRLRTWLDDHPTTRAMLEDAEQLPSNYDDRRDGEAAAERLLRRTSHQRRVDRGAAQRSRRRRWGLGKVTIGVVALLLMVVAGREWFRQDATLRSYVSAQGERLRIELPDGSRAELNVDSRLELSDDFGEHARSVRLDGEAYFEIKEDGERPFEVISEAVRVRVLGTSFGVGAYATDPEASVVVREGTVSVKVVQSSPSRNEELAEPHVLRAGQQASILDGMVRIEAVDTSSVLSWRNGWLVLRGVPLAEAARRMERWYSIEIELSEEIRDSLRIDAVFNDQTADEAVRIIAAALDLQYDIVERRVHFRK